MAIIANVPEPMEVDNNLKLAASRYGLIPPSLNTKVFKSECNYCFHTPYFPGGIFVSLKRFLGFCNRHVEAYAAANDETVFLHLHYVKVPRPSSSEPPAKELKIISENPEEIAEYNSVVVLPDMDVDHPISEAELGSDLYQVVQATIRHNSVDLQERLSAGVAEWDGGHRDPIPDAENLLQLAPPQPIPHSGWTCQDTGCDADENLWLNLTDGTVLCGRSQYLSDGRNSHAKIHAEQFGYPYVLKLGTVANGDADIHNYTTGEPVRDPYLARHLAHFGLDISKLEKTEKSTLELELDLNQKWEWSRCQEDGISLENAYGPNFTGLINIGSSCYINSVIQTMMLCPSFVTAYTTQFNTSMMAPRILSAYEEFNFHLTKLVTSLTSGDYSKRNSDYNGIKPTQFRRVAGYGHTEFSTARQQDAEEYIRHLFAKIEETLPMDLNPVDDFRFKVVKRLKDIASGRVRYEEIEEFLLSLPVHKDLLSRASASLDEEIIPQSIRVGPVPQPRKEIDLQQLLNNYIADQYIPDYKSPVTNERNGANQSYKLRTFPPFLLIQIGRYEADEHYQLKKVEINVNVPDELDLTCLQAPEPDSNEELLPDNDSPIDQTVIDEDLIHQILDTGVSRSVAELALRTTGTTSLQVALNWIFNNDEQVIAAQSSESSAPSSSVPSSSAPSSSRTGSDKSDEQVSQVCAVLACTPYAARFALENANSDVSAAVEWYFANSSSIPPEPSAEDLLAQQGPPIPERGHHFVTGPPQYRLRGFISHMGSTPHSGHYVCHLRRKNVWYLYNDEKVAVSQQPPKNLGYIYLFERSDHHSEPSPSSSQ